MQNNYDLIVIGGGPMGLSTAYQASRRGMKTLVLEKLNFLNDRGSSAGASRQFRLQYAQQYMAELALSSQDFWAEIQRYAQDTLITRSGSLWFGDPSLSSQEGGIQAAENVMDQLNIPYTQLTASEIEQQYFFKDLPEDYAGFFQSDGGIVNLKATERALFDQALASNLVDLKEWQGVEAIDSSVPNSIRVQTGDTTYTCGKLAITTGPYINQTMSLLNLKVPIDIWQMSSAYFKKADPQVSLPTWFVFQKPQDQALFYGFPEADWSHRGYLRVATDFPDCGILTDPSQRSLAPNPESLDLDSKWVFQHMRGLEKTPRFTSTCLIALSQDSSKELLLDYLPDAMPNNRNIVVYTAGWAGKLIPIMGDMICQMLTSDLSQFDYRSYQIDRSNFSIQWQSV